MKHRPAVPKAQIDSLVYTIVDDMLKWPLRIIVKGYIFLDASHFDPNEPHKGHAHGSSLVGTLWEIHPVLELVVLASMQPARPHADAKPPAKANGEKAKAADKPKH